MHMEHAMNDTQDREWVARTLAGDRSAFARLVDRYSGTVYAVACKAVGPGPEAEDVAQNVFLKIYENLATYRPSFRFFSWMYRIAINESLNAARRTRPFDTIEDQPISSGDDSSRLAETADLEDIVGEALMELRPEDRALVILRHYEDLPYRDIAYIMETTEPLVKSRLFSARQRLRSVMLARGIQFDA